MPNRTENYQRGTTLLETLVAIAICTTVVFSLAGLVTMATRQSKNLGSSLSQSATLAAQKLDELMGLQFTCSPQLLCAPTGGGTGTTVTVDSKLTAGGDLNSNATVGTNNYYDLLDATGGTAASGTAPFFTRRWVIEDLTTTTKRITVQVTGQAIGQQGQSAAPSTTLASIKAMQ